jgi:stage II sporulation protein D
MAILRQAFGRCLSGLLLLVLLATGCGDVYDLPALAAGEPPKIRVLLGGRRRAQATLEIAGQSWEIHSEAGATFVRRGRTDVKARIGPGARGVAIGGQDTGATVLRVRTRPHFTLEGTRYTGDLILHLDRGRVRFVNELDLETYVAGVIPNEMAPGAPGAAYRAQAVAARTYGWIRVAASGASRAVWHVTDDQSSQVYTGLDPRYEVAYAPMRDHTANTAGVILTWENRPFPAYYASTCGGHTTSAETSQLDPGGAAIPLRGVECKFCRTSPRFAWKKQVRDVDVIRGLEARNRAIVAPIHAIEVTRRGPGGWAAEVSITYGPGRKVRKLPGTEFRSALKLDSHLIVSIDRSRGRWSLRGRGWGHGVGMCQWGAMEMARRGFSETEILTWYYPGAAFSRVY